MISLKIIRVLVIIATFMVAKICWFVPSNYRWACQWLLYYCLGKGGKVRLPENLMKDLLPSLLWGREEGQIQFHNTSWYDGYGFNGRPALFYMIGCFTANVKKLENGYYISVEDIYDWHSSKEWVGKKEELFETVSFEESDGYEDVLDRYDELDWALMSKKERSYLSRAKKNLSYVKRSYDLYHMVDVYEERWHCSSVPIDLPEWIHVLLNKLFPTYYSLSGWPMGNKGFTNQLWKDLEKVGAKPFTSIFDDTISIYN